MRTPVARRVATRMLRVVATLGIGFHFFMIVLQATPLKDWLLASGRCDVLFRVADYYRAVSYANRNFRFFAPEVAGDRQLHLTLAERSGATRTLDLGIGSSGREMQLKLQAMLDHFSDGDQAERFAAAWASYAFDRDPAASRVIVEVTQHVLPSMREYRSGARIRSEAIYRRAFDR